MVSKGFERDSMKLKGFPRSFGGLSRSFRGSPKSIMGLQGVLGWLSYHMMEILNYGDLLLTDRAIY